MSSESLYLRELRCFDRREAMMCSVTRPCRRVEPPLFAPGADSDASQVLTVFERRLLGLRERGGGSVYWEVVRGGSGPSSVGLPSECALGRVGLSGKTSLSEVYSPLLTRTDGMPGQECEGRVFGCARRQR